MTPKELLEKSMLRTSFKKKLRLAKNFEKFSGPGTTRRIQRLIFASKIYLPYLFIVKGGMFKKESVTAKLFWDREIQIPLKDFDSLALYKFGFAGGTESELKLSRFFIKNIKTDDVFYDIGANYGFFTYLASELCLEVHSFEPIPELSSFIKDNGQNRNVFVNEIALSDQAGHAKLHISESTGLSTLISETKNIHTYKYTQEMRVNTETLDNYVANHTKPTVIKIDVEGAEESVLEGGKVFFKTYAPIIAMEVWGEKNGGDISMKAVEKLRSWGYKSFFIETSGSLRKTDGNISSLTPKTGGDNFIFKRD